MLGWLKRIFAIPTFDIGLFYYGTLNYRVGERKSSLNYRVGTRSRK